MFHDICKQLFPVYNSKSYQEEILKTASRSFQEGEIDFFQYIQSIETAKDMELEYLSNLNRYNQTIITLNHLIL